VIVAIAAVAVFLFSDSERIAVAVMQMMAIRWGCTAQDLKRLLTLQNTASCFWASQLSGWPFQISLAYLLGLHCSGPQKVC